MRTLWLLLIGGALITPMACGHTRIDREPETTALRPTPSGTVESPGWKAVSPKPNLREPSTRSIATGVGAGRAAVSSRRAMPPRPGDIGARVPKLRLRLPGNPERIPGLQPR